MACLIGGFHSIGQYKEKKNVKTLFILVSILPTNVHVQKEEFSDRYLSIKLMQLMCNYYTLRQDGSRAFVRCWNFQVKYMFRSIFLHN